MFAGLALGGVPGPYHLGGLLDCYVLSSSEYFRGMVSNLLRRFDRDQIQYASQVVPRTVAVLLLGADPDFL